MSRSSWWIAKVCLLFLIGQLILLFVVLWYLHSGKLMGIFAIQDRQSKIDMIPDLDMRSRVPGKLICESHTNFHSGGSLHNHEFSLVWYWPIIVWWLDDEKVSWLLWKWTTWLLSRTCGACLCLLISIKNPKVVCGFKRKTVLNKNPTVVCKYTRCITRIKFT